MTTKLNYRDRATNTLVHYLGQAQGYSLDDHCITELQGLVDDIIDATLTALLDGHRPLPAGGVYAAPARTQQLPGTVNVLDQLITNAALEDALAEYSVQKEEENYQRRLREIDIITRDLKRGFSAEVVELLNYKVVFQPTVQAIFIVKGNRLALRRFPYETGYKHYWKVCRANDSDLENGIELENESKEALFDAILSLVKSAPDDQTSLSESAPNNDQLITALNQGINQLVNAIALNGLLSARWVDAHDNTMELDAPDFDSLANDAIDLLAELDARLALEGKSS